MKHATKRKSVHLQYMWLFTFLFLIAVMTPARDSGESKNNQYSETEKKMKESYDKGQFKEVIEMYEELLDKERSFKKDSRKIWADIYRWTAFSYYEENDHLMGDIYLRNFYKMMKETQLNDTFSDIAKDIKEHFDNGELKQVIDLYKKYSGSDNKAANPPRKPGQELDGFKRVSEGIRAEIYQWVALSYDALYKLNLRNIYIKKILDIRLELGVGPYWPSIKNWAERNYVVAPKLLFGLKFGFNFTVPFASSTDPDGRSYIFDFTHSRGTQPGIIFEYALTKNFSVIMQLAYIDLRFQYEGSLYSLKGNLENCTHRLKLDYAEIPVLLKYQSSKGKLRRYLQSGLFYHYVINANKVLLFDPENAPPKSARIDIKNKIHRYNWGLWLGAGIGHDIKIGGVSLRLGIEVNFKYGFSNIVNKNNTNEENEIRVFGGYYWDIFDNIIKVSNAEISLKVLVPIYRKAFKR